MEPSDAHVELMTCKQGDDEEATKFFSRFEIAFEKAGMDQDNVFLRHQVQLAARNSITTTIFASGDVPNTYPEWRERIIRVDNTERMHKALLLMTTGPAAPKAKAWVPGQGITFGDQGEPMQIDAIRNCLKCGAPKTAKGACGSPWHLPNREGATVQRAEWNPVCRFCKLPRLTHAPPACPKPLWHKQRGQNRVRVVMESDDECLVRAAGIQAARSAQDQEDFQASQ